jgi:hypothetical protein
MMKKVNHTTWESSFLYNAMSLITNFMAMSDAQAEYIRAAKPHQSGKNIWSRGIYYFGGRFGGLLILMIKINP